MQLTVADASRAEAVNGFVCAEHDGGHALRWSWACRRLDQRTPCGASDIPGRPRPGDVAMVRVESVGQHDRLVTRDNKRLRIYPGDRCVGVFGNRYATDAFEGEVLGTDGLSMLTAAGMIGTVRSAHRKVAEPTRVVFEGFLADAAGRRLNLKERLFTPRRPQSRVDGLVVVVGTGMNSGKTTSSVKLIKGLAEGGLRVAACKLTGSVSNRDQDEMRSAAAAMVVDFSDYGFPSTYLASREELVDLWRTMLADVQAERPDVIVMELADGVLQRETAMLLEHQEVRDAVAGVVLTADSALSGLYALERLHALKHRVLAVTGVVTSSPLYMRELGLCSRVPVVSSTGSARDLVDLVARSHRQAA